VCLKYVWSMLEGSAFNMKLTIFLAAAVIITLAAWKVGEIISSL